MNKRSGKKEVNLTMNKEVEGKSIADSCKTGLKRKKDSETKKREHLSELSNFAFILIGEVDNMEKIKEYIVSEYVDTGLVKLVKPTYDKKEIYIVNEKEWKEYQRLKNKDERLIGYMPQQRWYHG